MLTVPKFSKQRECSRARLAKSHLGLLLFSRSFNLLQTQERRAVRKPPSEQGALFREHMVVTAPGASEPPTNRVVLDRSLNISKFCSSPSPYSPAKTVMAILIFEIVIRLAITYAHQYIVSIHRGYHYASNSFAFFLQHMRNSSSTCSWGLLLPPTWLGSQSIPQASETESWWADRGTALELLRGTLNLHYWRIMA